MPPAKTKHPYTAVMRRVRITSGNFRDVKPRHAWAVQVRNVTIGWFRRKQIAAKYCYWHNKWVSKHD